MVTFPHLGLLLIAFFFWAALSEFTLALMVVLALALTEQFPAELSFLASIF